MTAPDASGATAATPGSRVRSRLGTYGRRVLVDFVLAAAVGLVSGLLLAGYVWAVDEQVFERLLASGWSWAYLVAPAVGISIAAVVVRFLVPSRRPDTSEAYVEAYHAETDDLRPRDAPGRALASAATIGLGGSMGLEGPAVYFGATIGAEVQRRFRRWFATTDVKVLMVAGAAAGIAAVFKAPLTGVLFALEAPYTDDLVRRALIPSLVSASVSYLAFTALIGPQRLFGLASGPAETTYPDLLLAVALGVVCAVAARLFVASLSWSRRVLRPVPAWARAPLAGLAVGATGVAAYLLAGSPVVLGPGIEGTRTVVALDTSVTVLLALFGLKVVATALTRSGGGSGGLFFPLVFMGATIGQAFGGVVSPTARMVFPVVGIAAMVGAGFRSPLAAVAFAAETTGQPAFIIPALLAAAFAQSLMGGRSVSPAQVPHRRADLDRRMSEPCRNVCTAPVPTVEAATRLDSFADAHLLTSRLQAIPVVDGGRVAGIVRAGALVDVDHDDLPTLTVGDVMEADPVVVDGGETLGRAVEAMVRRGSDLAVVASGTEAYGILAAADVAGLADILRFYRHRTGHA